MSLKKESDLKTTGLDTFDRIVGYFDRQVVMTPNAIAIEYGTETWSYKELYDYSKRVSSYLLTHQYKSEQTIGVCLSRSPKLIAIIIGILKAGLAYVPIDPKYPANRVKDMLILSRSKLVFIEESTKGMVSDCNAMTIDVDQITHSNGSFTQILDGSSSNLAFVIFTSGSTGRPKGVMIEHGNVCALIDWTRRTFSQDECRRVLCSTSVCFDLFVFELWAALSTGGTLVLVENGLSLLQRDYFPTLINTVPSVAQTLLDDGYSFKGTITVNLAGEPLKKSIVNQLLTQPSVGTVNNLYGPTEDTTYSTHKRFTHKLNVEPTIGSPIDQTFYEILSDDGRRVKRGEVGELLLGGKGVSRGYINQPKLTAERFIESPFDHSGETILYKTGDLVKENSEGELVYCGRIDHQVKIRGFRIELNEIQSRILSYPLIKDAMVSAMSIGGNQTLVTHYIREMQFAPEDHDKLIQEIKSKLSLDLPSFMIPEHFVALDNFPLTLNGKVDRTKLPPPKLNEEVRGPIAFSSNQKILFNIWSELLKHEAIGLNDSFFNIGGNSLLAARMANRLEKHFNIKLAIAQLYQLKTIRRIAEALEKKALANPYILPFNEIEASTPIFFVPGAGGRVSYLNELALQFKKRSVYGFQAQGIDDGLMPHEDVKSMAAFNVFNLNQCYPDGPVYLLGHSLGASVAYEMALQLKQQGREVPLLIVLDGGNLMGEPMSRATAFRHVSRILARFSGIEFNLSDGDFYGSDWREQLSYAYDLGQNCGWIPNDMSIDELSSMVHTYRTHMSMLYLCDNSALEQVMLFHTKEFSDYNRRMKRPQFLSTWAKLSKAPVIDFPLEISHMQLVAAEQSGAIYNTIEQQIRQVKPPVKRVS